MIVCYFLFEFLTVCPEGKLPPETKPYVVRDLEKGTEAHYNKPKPTGPVTNWYMPQQFEPPKLKPFVRIQ